MYLDTYEEMCVSERYGEDRQGVWSNNGQRQRPRPPKNQYPSEKTLLDLVSTGPSVYGSEALRPDCPLSDGAKRLVDALEESAEPLWVLCWGAEPTFSRKRCSISTIQGLLRCVLHCDLAFAYTPSPVRMTRATGFERDTRISSISVQSRLESVLSGNLDWNLSTCQRSRSQQSFEGMDQTQYTTRTPRGSIFGS